MTEPSKLQEIVQAQEQHLAAAQAKPATPADTIRNMIAQNMNRITQALPSAGVTPERLATIAFSAIRKSPTLMECTPASLVECIIKSAELGLNPGLLGHCHLVPYGKEATFIIGYQGMLELARRSGSIAMIYAKAVYAKDDFHYAFGLNPDLHHVPFDGDQPKDWENVTHVYMVARFTNGGFHFGVMTKADVEAHRDKFAKGLDQKKYGEYTSPWRTSPIPMALKTVIRQEWKYLPVSTEIRQAVAEIEQWEGDTAEGKPQAAWTRDSALGMLSDAKPAACPEPAPAVEPEPEKPKAKPASKAKAQEKAPEPAPEPSGPKMAHCQSCGCGIPVTDDATESDVAAIACPECHKVDLTLRVPATPGSQE